MATRVLHDSLAAWSGWSGGTFTASNGWVAGSGNAFGQPCAYKASGLSTHLGYFEVEFYETGNADNWGMFAANWGTDPTSYNNSGDSVICRGTGAATPGQMLPAYGTGSYTLPAVPSTPSTSIRWGIEITGATTGNLYVNRVLVAALTFTTDHSAKRNVAIGVHNGETAYFRNLNVWDAFPGSFFVTGVTNNTCSAGGSVTATFTGTGFSGTPTATVSGSDVTVSSVTVTSSTSMDVTFAAGPTAAIGVRDVEFTMSGGTVETPVIGALTIFPAFASIPDDPHNGWVTPDLRFTTVPDDPENGWVTPDLRFVTPADDPVNGWVTIPDRADQHLPTDPAIGWGTIPDRADQILPVDPAQGWGTIPDRADQHVPTDTGQGWSTSVINATPDQHLPADTGQGWGDVPVITGFTPVEGIASGGTVVTITGVNFGSITSVTFGGTAGTITASTSTTITVATPAHAIGAVAVVVTTSSGASTAPGTFLYFNLLTVSLVTPSSGTDLGGTTVTVNGTGFTGVTTGGVTFDGIAGTSITVVSDSALTVVSPAHADGVVDVVVTNTRATSPVVTADQYTYTPPPPSITVMSPTTGPSAGGTSVVLTGTNLSSVVNITFGGVGGTITVQTSTSITVTSPPGAAGPATVVANSPYGAGSPPGPFTYYAPITVTAVSPATGSVDGGTVVTVTGSGFLDGVTGVTFGVPAGTSLSVLNDTRLTIISPAHALGTVDIRVTNAHGTSPIVTADQFTYIPIGPTISAMTPVEGTTAGGTSVTLTGAHLDTITPVTGVTFGGVTGTITAQSAGSITVTTPAHVAAIGVAVVATSPYGTASPPQTFTFYNALAVTAVSPVTGTTVGGTTVTVTGTGFLGTTGVAFGATAGTAITVLNDTSLTVRSPAHTAGLVDITVTNTRPATSAVVTADEFTYINPPIITGISPPTGPSTGGTAVTITGTNLTNVDTVLFGTVPGIDVVVVNDTTVTVTSPRHVGGTIAVTTVAATIPSPGSGELYTFTNIPPVAVISATPTSGDVILSVLFDATGSTDADGDIISAHWDFGDGSTANNLTWGHSYTAPGTYTVTLTVTDDAGSVSAPVTTTITVGTATGDIPPVAVATASTSSGTAPLLVVFTGSASYDPDGSIIGWSWDFGDGTGDHFRNTYHIYRVPGTFSVTLTVTDNNGVTNTSTPIIIDVPSAPTPDQPFITSLHPASGSTSGGDTIRVKGLNLLAVTSVTIDGYPATIRQWVSDNSLTIVSPPHAVGAVQVRATSLGGTSPAIPESLYTYVGPPTAHAGPSSQTFDGCGAIGGATPTGVDVSFSSAGSSPGLYGPLRYYWDFGDGGLLNFGDSNGSVDANPTHTYWAFGTFTVTLVVTDSRGITASSTCHVTIVQCPVGPGGGGYGGGGGGGWPGGGNPDNNPPPDPDPPRYLQATCDAQGDHITGGWAYSGVILSTPPMFSETWATHRTPTGQQFTITATALVDIPAYQLFYGALAITADGNFPGPSPSSSSVNLGYGTNRAIISTSGVSLVSAYSGAMWTPHIVGGVMHAGASVTLRVTAPDMLEIAYAQFGFADIRGFAIWNFDIAVGYVNVDCDVDQVFLGKWTRRRHPIGGYGA